MEEVIVVKNVSKIFNNNKVLYDINFKINKGDIIGILGRSGSGKSVILKIISGFISPTTGSIKTNKKIGFSVQSNSLYETLTLKQNLNYFAKIYEVKNSKEQIEKLIKFLHLESYKKILVKNLSGGTKKRLDIACALLEDPEILILDEPFVGLDSFLVNELSMFIKILQKKNNTIIISSHLLHQLENLCSRFLFVEKGKLKEITKDQLKNLYMEKIQ